MLTSLAITPEEHRERCNRLLERVLSEGLGGIVRRERPFLDSGDDTEIRPGMVFTVEPGVYARDSAASATRTRFS